MPKLYVIAGPNGAGKTTYYNSVLPDRQRLADFMNADEIARCISPTAPETALVKAGRLMLRRIQELGVNKKDFTIETTLSGRTYLNSFEKLKNKNYEIEVHFLWLKSVEISIQRVKQRVENGGHHIPLHIIERRFGQGISNLFNHYWKVIDKCEVYDNSDYTKKKLIFEKYPSKGNNSINPTKEKFIIHDTELFSNLLGKHTLKS